MDKELKQYYYQVAPAAKSYHGKEPLTYRSDHVLDNGQVVKITLKHRQALGVVLESVAKPSFSTTTISDILTGIFLPQPQIELLDWMHRYYPGPLGPLTQHFIPGLLGDISLENQKKDTPIKINPPKPVLTEEQQKVLGAINSNPQGKTFLLHGETGSGKTRVYIELATRCLQAGKSVLVLTPEISLTSPLKTQLEAVFGKNRVLCTHSNLTIVQKRKIWTKLLSQQEPYVLIGPRSALFLPSSNLGLIVVDESHDQAYKQESLPYYHALRVASKLSAISRSNLVFGSATPAASEYFMATAKNIPVLRMKKLAIPITYKVPPPIVVDLSDNSERSSHALLSRTLLAEIKKTLDDKLQVLLFLNRRGSARAILCQDCGWRSMCPNCDVALTYHQDSHGLLCHICGHRASPPAKCPDCASTEVLFKNPGTKAIHASIEKIFPNAQVARFDKDNKKHERIEQNYADLTAGKIDILIGTQLLVKGHDLPRLGLVAMLAADSGLEFPDYTSEERCYQLIRQLSGRINRGHTPGNIVLQTYEPKSPMLTQATSGSWEDFYTLQIQHRAKLQFPPLVHALKIELTRAQSSSAQSAIEKLSADLATKYPVRLIGPSPGYIERRGGKYHWQLIVTAKNREVLVQIAKDLPAGPKIELDPINFL